MAWNRVNTSSVHGTASEFTGGSYTQTPEGTIQVQNLGANDNAVSSRFRRKGYMRALRESGIDGIKDIQGSTLTGFNKTEDTA